MNTTTMHYKHMPIKRKESVLQKVKTKCAVRQRKAGCRSHSNAGTLNPFVTPAVLGATW